MEEQTKNEVNLNKNNVNDDSQINRTMKNEPPSLTYQQKNPTIENRHRRLMRQKIKLLLLRRSSRKPNNAEHFVKDLTSMSAQIDNYLYRTATSLSDYINEGTLKERILDIVQGITLARQKERIQERNK